MAEPAIRTNPVSAGAVRTWGKPEAILASVLLEPLDNIWAW